MEYRGDLSPPVKRMFTTVSLTSSAFKAKIGNTASLNNVRDLYHVATHQKQGCEPYWVPSHRLRSQAFMGSVNVV